MGRIYPVARPRKPRTPYSYRKKNKYKAAGRREDGRFFHSNAEADRYVLLKELERNGRIRGLRCQIPFVLSVNGEPICRYIADFQYEWMSESGSALGLYIEDVKGMVLADYVIKRKLMFACHQIPVLEVPARLVAKTASLAGQELAAFIRQMTLEKAERRKKKLKVRRAPPDPDKL